MRPDDGEVEKEGFFTGRVRDQPVHGEPVPVWVANFVLGEYGTGAVMAVPAHDQRDFEFARKYGLPVRVVIQPADGADAARRDDDRRLREDGLLVDSGAFNGLTSAEALARMRRKPSARASAKAPCSTG